VDFLEPLAAVVGSVLLQCLVRLDCGKGGRHARETTAATGWRRLGLVGGCGWRGWG
jgi:hypothetical protein